MINSLSLRSKIMLFLLPALAYMIAVSGALAYQYHQIRAQADEVELSAKFFGVSSALIQVMQKERGLSSNY